MEGDGRHGAYNRLASITDNFGHRVTGSQALEDSIGKTCPNSNHFPIGCGKDSDNDPQAWMHFQIQDNSH